MSTQPYQPTPEHVEGQAAQGYSPADVAKLLGADIDAGPLKEAYRRGAERWRNNGKMTPPAADAVICHAVWQSLKQMEPGDTTNAAAIREMCLPYQLADILVALESLFDEGYVELFTIENSENVDVTRTDKIWASKDPKAARAAKPHGNTKVLDLGVVEDLFAQGLSVPQACKELGISLASFYKRKDKEFLDAVELGRKIAEANGRKIVRQGKKASLTSTPVAAASLIATRDELFARVKALTAQKQAIEQEIVAVSQAHEAIVTLLRVSAAK